MSPLDCVLSAVIFAVPLPEVVSSGEFSLEAVFPEELIFGCCGFFSDAAASAADDLLLPLAAAVTAARSAAASDFVFLLARRLMRAVTVVSSVSCSSHNFSSRD